MVLTPRGMSMLEIMVTMSVIAVIATAGTTSVVDQVRRAKATDAASGALFPHTVARDRAVARRSCTETVLVPALPDPFVTDIADFPANAQRSVPRVAVIEWSSCESAATIANIQFFSLDGDVTLQPYSSDDGRAVFGQRGGLTLERPGAVLGIDIDGKGNPPTCQPPGGAGLGGGIAEGEGEGEADPKGGASCSPPPPVTSTLDDLTFGATTFFGKTTTYTIFARAGATEAS